MKLRKFRIPGIALGLLLALASCARAPLKNPAEAMRRTSAPALSDDLPTGTLLDAVATEIAFFEALPAGSSTSSTMKFGEQSFTRDEYLAALKALLQFGRTGPTPEAFFEWVREKFDFYEVYGRDSWGEIFLTSYFEPLLQGSRKPTPAFSQPLYAAPDDIILADPAVFDPKYVGDRKFKGRVVGNTFVPYFSRSQIDSAQALKGRKLELCWVDPIDSFFLQVQGSGAVVLDDGTRLQLNYAESNGHKYESIGNALRSYIPADQLNLHTIEAWLRSRPREEMQKVLNLNPSYVFFRNSDQSALTFLGVPATDGRSIATDRKFFPKGALAFLMFPKPVFASPADQLPSGSEPTARFVLDQDIGGAITGPGRVDLFWGRGAEAKHYAGAVKDFGRLYYLAPKRP